MISYIEDLKLLASLPPSTVTKKEEFLNPATLLSLLKWNALFRIGHSLLLFSNPKYKQFSQWEKFNMKFQIELTKMSTAHSYFMTALNF